MTSKWDARFIRLSREIASWSKDRSTQVGAVIVAEDKTPSSYGYNGFPREVDDDAADRHERPDKYDWTEHAERNAIYNATRTGQTLMKNTIYVTHIPCPDCARAIIQVGIKRVVVDKASIKDADFQERWDEKGQFSQRMFEEAGVEIGYGEALTEEQLRDDKK